MMIFLKLISSCLASLCRAYRKKAVLVFNDPKSKGWEEIGNISLKSHSQILEEARKIHNSVQFTDKNKTSKKMNRKERRPK